MSNQPSWTDLCPKNCLYMVFSKLCWYLQKSGSKNKLKHFLRFRKFLSFSLTKFQQISEHLQHIKQASIFSISTQLLMIVLLFLLVSANKCRDSKSPIKSYCHKVIRASEMNLASIYTYTQLILGILWKPSYL